MLVQQITCYDRKQKLLKEIEKLEKKSRKERYLKKKFEVKR